MALQKVYVFTKSVFKETEVLIVLGKKTAVSGQKQGFHLYWVKCPHGFRPRGRFHQNLLLVELLSHMCSERTLANPPPTSWRGAQPSESGWSLPAQTVRRPPHARSVSPSLLLVTRVCLRSPLTALWRAGALCLLSCGISFGGGLPDEWLGNPCPEGVTRRGMWVGKYEVEP